MENLIARWESRSGKHWVDLYFNPAFKLANGQTITSAHYKGVDCGGGLSASTPESAIAELQRRVDTGYFQPDANKTPMKRVR